MSYLASDDDARHVWKFGCGALLAIPLLALGLCSLLWPRWMLPDGLEDSRVLASSSSLGLREGCEMAVYRLSEKTARTLLKKGPSALQIRGPAGHGDARNPYGPWLETPGQLDVERNGNGASYTAFGLYALGGCSDTSDSKYRAREIREALKVPGSYYRVSANREGIFVVVPRQRLAGYYYWG